MTIEDFDTDEIEEITETAQAQRERVKAEIQKLNEVQDGLHERADVLLENGFLDESEREAITAGIKDGRYGDVRVKLEAAAPSLEFTDDEKRTIAVACSETLEEIVAEIELMRNAISRLADKGWNQEDLVAYLYGANSKLNKGTIRACFDVVGETASDDVDDDDMARYVAHKAHDVTVDGARAFIKGLKEAQSKVGYPAAEAEDDDTETQVPQRQLDG